MADGSVEIKIEGDAQEFIQSINKAVEAADRLKQALQQVGSNISSELSNAGNAVESVAGSMDGLSNSLDGVSEGAESLGNSMDEAGNSTEELYDYIQNMEEAAIGSTDAMEELGDSMDEAGDSTEELYDYIQEMEEAAIGSTDAMEGFSEAVGDAEDSVERFGDSTEETGEGFDRVRESAEGAGEGVRGLGDIFKGTFLGNLAANAITAVVDGLKDMATQAVEAGTNFTSAMSQVGATMGMSTAEIEAGSESFTMLEEAAKVAGSTTAFSATQAAEALNYLALAGYDATTAADTLPAVLNLAAAGGMDLAYASDLATDAMSALGIEAGNENLTHFGDEMAMTASKANTSVAQLGEAILTVGGTAKGLAGGTVELNAALGILANNGIKGAEGGTALRNVILSLTAPTDKAAAKMKDLGIEAGNENLTHFGDEMAMTASKANTSVAQLGEAILTVGGTAKGLAGGTVELNAALGILANNGIKGAEGGTALRNVILSLTAPTDKAAAKMKDLGIEVNDAQGNMRPLNEIFKDFNASLADMSESEKTNALNEIFNKVDLKSVQALLAGCGDEFDNLATAIENSGGAMQNMADVQMDNLQGDVTTMQSALEGLQIAIFEKMEGPMRSATQTITGLISGLQGIISGTTQVNPALAGLAAALTAAFISIPIVQNISKITSGIIAMGGAIKKAGVFLATSLANPATLAIAAVAGLAAVIVTLTKKSRELSEEEQAAKDYVDNFTNSINQQREAQSQLAETRKSTMASSMQEIDLTQKYIKELKDLTDETGHVNEREKARADYLTEYINQHVPGAIEAAEDEAGAYYKISESIDDLIFKQKQAAALQAFGPEFQNATSNYGKSLSDLAAAQADLNTKTQEYEKAVKTFGEFSPTTKKLKSELETAQETFDNAKESVKASTDTINEFNNIASATAESAGEMDAAIARLSGSVTAFTGDNNDAVIQAYNEMLSLTNGYAEQVAQGWANADEATQQEMRTMLDGMLTQLAVQEEEFIKAGGQLPQDFSMGIQQAIPGLSAQAASMMSTLITSMYPDGATTTQIGALIDTFIQAGLISGEVDVQSAAQSVMEAIYGETKVDASKVDGGKLDTELANDIRANANEPVQAAEEVSSDVSDTFANASTDGAAEGGTNAGEAYANGINSSAGLAVNAAGNLVSQTDSTVGGNTASAGFPTHGNTVSSNFASGINSGTGLAVNAAGNLVLQTSSTASSAVAGAGFDSTGKQIPSLIGNAVTGAVETVNSAVRSMVQGTQGAASSAVGSLNFSSIGSMISQGIAGGITSATGFVTGAVRSVISAAKAAAQAAANIASPSKLFRDEVGLYIGQGIAVGITEAESDVDDALQGMVYRSVSHLSKINEQIEDIQVKAAERAAAKELQAHKESIAEKEKTIKDLEVEAEEKIGEAKADERAKVEQDYKEKVEKAEKELLKLQEDWDEKQLQAEEKAQTDRLKSLQEYLEEVKSKQEDFAEKIALGTDELFTREDDDKTFKLLDFQTAIDELTAYQNAIQEIQNRGIDADLMDQVLGMSRDDATEYMNALLNMTDDKFEEYLDGWRAYQEKSREISEQVYFADSNELDEWVDEFYDTAGSLKDGTKPAGEDAMKALQEGLEIGGQAAIKTAQGIVASINSVFAGMAKMPAFSSRVSSAMAATSSQLATYSGARAGAQTSVAAATTSAVGGMMGSVLSTIAGSANRDIVLNVDGKTLARTTINSFAEVSKQSPAIKNTGR